MEEGEGKTQRRIRKWKRQERRKRRGGGGGDCIKDKNMGRSGYDEGKVLWIKTQKVIVNTYITKNS